MGLTIAQIMAAYRLGKVGVFKWNKKRQRMKLPKPSLEKFRKTIRSFDGASKEDIQEKLAADGFNAHGKHFKKPMRELVENGEIFALDEPNKNKDIAGTVQYFYLYET